MLRIGPFNYDPLRSIDLWLAQSDEFLLRHLSTSPEVEPPHFAMQVIVIVVMVIVDIVYTNEFSLGSFDVKIHPR